jgi:hypothetical protein
LFLTPNAPPRLPQRLHADRSHLLPPIRLHARRNAQDGYELPHRRPTTDTYERQEYSVGWDWGPNWSDSPVEEEERGLTKWALSGAQKARES